MKTIYITCILPVFLLLAVASPAIGQTSTSGGQQAQTEIKSDQKKERQRKKMENKAEKNSEQISTSPKHGWLFRKKRMKKIEKKDSEH